MNNNVALQSDKQIYEVKSGGHGEIIITLIAIVIDQQKMVYLLRLLLQVNTQLLECKFVCVFVCTQACGHGLCTQREKDH